MDTIFSNFLDAYTMRIIILIGINLILALGINLVSGMTGQLNMGHAGFMSIGAYTSAICSLQFDTPFFLSLLIGAMTAGLFGFLIGIPILRLDGDYLAMVTIGFCEIVRVFFLNFAPGGKAVGLSGIPQHTTLTLVWLIVIIILFLNYHLNRSRVGRAMFAIKENEIAAEACGINISRLKIIAFTVAAFLGGLGGGLYSHYIFYISPQDFSFMKSIELLNMVVLGGMGSLPGTVLGTVILTIAPEALRVVAEYRLLFYGGLMVVLMIFRPNGILGGVRWYDIKQKWMKMKQNKKIKEV